MTKALYKYLADDHDRLDGLFQRASANAAAGEIDLEAYHEFRKGILRHISMEEKIVLPAILKAAGTKPKAWDQLHADHAAIVTLLAPPPSAGILRTIAAILQVHNALEEDPGGLYDALEELPGAEAAETLARLQSAPPVAVLPNNSKPEVLEEARKAVMRAGHEFKTAW